MVSSLVSDSCFTSRLTPRIFTLSSFLGFPSAHVHLATSYSWAYLKMDWCLLQGRAVVFFFSSKYSFIYFFSLVSPGWISLVFSICPPWPQILCRRKIINSFDILSVSTFVFAAAAHVKCSSGQVFSDQTLVTFASLTEEHVFGALTLPSRSAHDQTLYFYFCVITRFRHNMIMICVFAGGGSLIWFAGCGIALSYWLRLHLRWMLIQDQHVPHLSCKHTHE